MRSAPDDGGGAIVRIQPGDKITGAVLGVIVLVLFGAWFMRWRTEEPTRVALTLSPVERLDHAANAEKVKAKLTALDNLDSGVALPLDGDIGLPALGVDVRGDFVPLTVDAAGRANAACLVKDEDGTLVPLEQWLMERMRCNCGE